jgi:hypothetical protein
MFAKFGWPLALICLCLCLHANAEEEGDIQLERQNSCSFYCFMLPKKASFISIVFIISHLQKDPSASIQKSIDALNDLNCTHLVYGEKFFRSTTHSNNFRLCHNQSLPADRKPEPT